MGPSRVVKPQRNIVEARHQKKPYNRPQTLSQGLKCFQCGGEHLKRGCPRLTRNVGASVGDRKCFVCDQIGHFADKCPNKKTVAKPRPQLPSIERPRVAGRVFALTSTKANRLGNLIQDICVMLGQNVWVLFDSGASHSFISNACVGRLRLEVCNLGCELVVSTLAFGKVTTNSSCHGCSIKVAGRRFKVNLICLSLEGLDMILGMD
ncbi:uncharacterized protein LOC114163449 [Vigna unguiculata]|uniref:uncharacterized protein LOC114163449 n=1 Tax=Vigna unguiculata TaxID=3917 RepID=UPI0010167F66|nr:uncharacterized protein LOC114163449 [Vigna unguiculata]